MKGHVSCLVCRPSMGNHERREYVDSSDRFEDRFSHRIHDLPTRILEGDLKLNSLGIRRVEKTAAPIDVTISC
jgi:hypothetical protein